MDISIELINKEGLISNNRRVYDLNCLGNFDEETKKLEIVLIPYDDNYVILNALIDGLNSAYSNGKTPKCDITITFYSTSPPSTLDKIKKYFNKKPVKEDQSSENIHNPIHNNSSDDNALDDVIRIGGVRSKKGGKKTTKKSKKSKKGGKSRKNKKSGSKKHF